MFIIRYDKLESDGSWDAFENYRQDRQFKRVSHDYEEETWR